MRIKKTAFLGAALLVITLTLPVSTALAEGDSDSEYISPSVARDTVNVLTRKVYDHAQLKGQKVGATWKRVQAGIPILVHDPDSVPKYYIVSGIDLDTKEVLTRVGVDAETGEWQWYVEECLAKTFPPISEQQAKNITLDFMQKQGISGWIDGPLCIEMPNNGLYWGFQVNEGGQITDIYVNFENASQIFTNLNKKELRLNMLPLNPGDSAIAQPLLSIEKEPGGQAPASYDITVTHYYQETSWYCGEACTEMLFDYYGPRISQDDIGDVANEDPSYGTYASDLRRATHFSDRSTAIQNPTLQGYTERALGYGAHQRTSMTSWLSDLKEVIASDHPVVILGWYSASHSSGHFRVVKGYDDSLGEIITHDPWYNAPFQGPNQHFSYTYFNDLWSYSEYWGMMTSPWDVSVTCPSTVAPSASFTVTAIVEYVYNNNFSSQYAASNSQAQIHLPAGYSLASGQTQTKTINITTPGGSETVAWDVIAPTTQSSDDTITVDAFGEISGSSYSYSSYTDRIGGQGQGVVTVSPVRYAVTDPYWDDIGSILTAMGYDFVEIQDSQLADYDFIKDFDAIFINCSADSDTNAPAAEASLKQYVQNGGAIYASDWAFIYLETSFPAYIDFPANPYIGVGGQYVTATVTDSGLAEYLGANTVELYYNLSSWVVISDVGPDTDVLLQGTYETTSSSSSSSVPSSKIFQRDARKLRQLSSVGQTSTMTNKPLAVFFRYGDGSVTFTTFHNEPQLTELQEKLLQYFILKPATTGPAQDLIDQIIEWGGSVVAEIIDVISQGVTSSWTYVSSQIQDLIFGLGWGGSTMKLSVYRPDGSLYAEQQSSGSSIFIEVPNAEVGEWTYKVTAVDVPLDNYPFVVEIGAKETTPTTGSISGTISYTGTQTGDIYISAFDQFLFTGPAVADTSISTPGPYSITGLPEGTYYVLAQVLISGGDVPPLGVYGPPHGPPDPVIVTVGQDTSSIDITLRDPGSISGTLSYAGTQTGTIYLGASLDPSLTAIAWLIIPELGSYSVDFPSALTWYIFASIDSNENGEYDDTEAFGMYGAPDPVTVEPGIDTPNINITLVDPTAPPTGTIVINNGAKYTRSKNVTLTLDAENAATMCFSNDNSSWSVWENYATSKSWTLTSGDRRKTVYVKFKDASGLESDTYSDTIILDTTPPTGSISINKGAAYTDSRSVTLALSATDAATMCFSNDNSSWSVWENCATSKSWTLTSGDGTKRVYVRFMDNAGNVSETYSDTIILDTTPPNVAITSPKSNTYVGGTPNIIGTATDIHFRKYQLYYGQGESPSSWNLIKESSSSVDNSTLGSWDTTKVTDGTYTIKLWADDKADNSAETKVKIFIDNTPPEIENLRLDQENFIPGDYASSTPTILATLTDTGSGIDETTIDLRIKPAEGDEIVVPTSSVSFNSETGEMSYTVTEPLADSEYAVSINVKDKVGNSAEEKATEFVIESELAMNKVLNYPNPFSSDTKFTYHLTRDVDEVTVKVYTVAGEIVKTIDFASSHVGYNEEEWDGINDYGEELANGTYVYKITVKFGDEKVSKVQMLTVLK